MSDKHRSALLADIGGTNARFAVWRDGDLGPVSQLSVCDYMVASDAIEAFLKQAVVDSRPPEAVLAVAGPVTGDRARLSNGSWEFSAPALRARFGFTRVTLINDFAALALALPRLTADDVRQVGRGAPLEGAPMAVIGPGTGLGVAALCPTDSGPVAVASEGGHATLAPYDRLESELLDCLRDDLHHVAAEDVLSGHGLVRLYGTIAELEDLPAPNRDAAGIIVAAQHGSCLASARALDVFCAMLGGLAGDIALTFGARGGVYIAGGIVPRLLDDFGRSRFRARFEDKSAFAAYVAAIPTYIVARPDPTFLGLVSLLDGT
jgi:glucokinase